MAKKKPVKKPAAKKPAVKKLTQGQLDQRQAATLVDQQLAPTLAELNQQRAQGNLDLAAAPGKVQQQLAPTLAEITRQETQQTADAARRQEFTTALTQTVAGMAGAVAPATQQTYQQAGENQSNFAKGFSDTFKAQQAANAAQTNTTLQQSGAPQAQMLPGDTGAADALYGMSGYEPASTFNREGAGWTAAAAQLPTTTGLAGQQYLRAAQTQDAQAMSDIRDQATQVELKRPGMVSSLTDPLQSSLNSILSQITQAKLKRPGLINDVLGQLSTNRSKAQQQAYDNKFAAKALGIKVSTANANLKLNTYKAQTDAAYKQATLVLRQQGLNISVAKAKASAKKSGLTTSQWLGLQQTAGELAGKAHTVETKRERQTDNTYKTVVVTPMKTYDEALAEQINNGVPKQMATATLNRTYRAGSERLWYKSDLAGSSRSGLAQLASKMQAAAGTTSGALSSYNFNTMGKSGIVNWILKYQPPAGTY